MRSEKKEEVKDMQSQIVGGAGESSPDTGLPNLALINKVAKYARQDNVPVVSSSVLGDFTRMLDMQSDGPTQDNGIARNQLMAMAYSTLQQKGGIEGSSDRIIESQQTYQLQSDYGLGSGRKGSDPYQKMDKSQMMHTTGQYGMEEREKKAVSNAKRYSKFGNGSMVY